jgi:serine/threonine protein kinase
MAPEQAEDARSADVRSDLYSLGATLFHLLTGQLPVAGKSYMHRLQCLLTAPPRPLLEARPDAPPALAALVDRLRERNPAARPQSADEVIRLIESLATQAPAENPNTSRFRALAACLCRSRPQGALSRLRLSARCQAASGYCPRDAVPFREDAIANPGAIGRPATSMLCSCR